VTISQQLAIACPKMSGLSRFISHRKRVLAVPTSMPHMKNPARISRAGLNRLVHKKAGRGPAQDRRTVLQFRRIAGEDESRVAPLHTHL
jgi:hypothetical protein